MNRHLLFTASVLIIALLIISTFTLNLITEQGSEILSLEKRIVGYLLEIDALKGRETISCRDSFFGSRYGRQYLKLSANASESGEVFLHVENVYREPVFFINIREVLMVYEKGEVVTDVSTTPTFKNIGTNRSCTGTLYPGDSVVCVSGYYSDAINETIRNGRNTFIIKYLTAELGIDPYNFVSSDLCVRIEK